VHDPKLRVQGLIGLPSSWRVSIGGLEFRLSAGGPGLRLESDPAYRCFAGSPEVGAPAPGSAAESGTAVRIRPFFEGETIFRSSATWSILARAEERAVVFRHPDGGALYAAVFRPGAQEVVVQCSPRLLVDEEGTGPVLTSPFHYPLDQILTMYLLGETGIVLHAAGALVRGRGLAFVGVSGAGKTTLTALAAGRADWTALSDDRVIVRLRRGGAPTLHGTPWPGEGRAAENRSGPLAGVLFLEQGAANEIRPVRAQDALARMLRTTSVPWYDSEYVAGVLEACGRVAASVPVGVLTFQPEAEAIDLVERFLAGTVFP
jgi:hypothetical protein